MILFPPPPTHTHDCLFYLATSSFAFFYIVSQQWLERHHVDENGVVVGVLYAVKKLGDKFWKTADVQGAMSSKIRADILAYEKSDLFADICLITKIRTRLGRSKMKALRELLQYQQAKDGSGKLERRCVLPISKFTHSYSGVHYVLVAEVWTALFWMTA